MLLQAVKRVGVASLKGGAGHLTAFLKDCIQIQPTSFCTTLLTRDEDVEVQGSGHASILPKSGRGMDLGLDKDPLIWEIPILTQHCDEKVRTVAKQIVGKLIF